MTIKASAGSLDRQMARAVAWSAAGRWASQIVSWGSTIVIARLLTPYDYGLVGMSGLYLQFALLIGQSGIGESVITLRDLKRRQIAELNSVSLMMGLGLVGLTCGLALPLTHFFSAPPLFAVIIVASVAYPVNALQVIPRALLQRDLRFKLLSGIETGRVFSQILLTILFAWFKFGYWSLVLGNLISIAIASASTFYCRPQGFAVPHFGQLGRELKFGRDVLLSRIASYIYDNADFGVAGRVLGGTALGNYTVAWTISAAPIEKIGNLFTTVTPAFFSAVQTEKAELSRYLLRLTELLSFVTVPASIGIALVADYLVPVLLGPQWAGVVGPLRLLGFFVAVRSVATILPNLLTAIGDARFVMWATVGAAIIMPCAFLVGSRWGTNGIASAWVFAYPLVMIPLFYRALKKTGLKFKEYLFVVMPAISASVMMTGVVLLIRFLLKDRPHSLSALLLLSVCGALSYAGALFVFHRTRVKSLIHTVTLLFRSEQKA
jgi:O-antigen/teichoic acid export membrane protein